MSETIYFVAEHIPESLQTLLDIDQPLSPAEILKPTQKSSAARYCHWTVQTFLYMRQAGLNVQLVDQPVSGAICLVHYDVTKNKVFAPDSFVVGIRADRAPLRVREIEVVQNPTNLGGSDRFLMNYWPQSRITPRDPARGNHIEQISYFGGPGGLSPQFRDPAFTNALKALGVTLKLCYSPTEWDNYRETDLVLAVRSNLHPLLLDTKPASKLINAWQAQTVALLGDESAFRAVGNPEQDYFEVTQPQEVLDLVTRLKCNPLLYQQIRQSGIARYPEFDFEAVQQQWVELLTGPVTKAFVQWQQGVRKRPVSQKARRYSQFFHQWIDHKLFYSRVRSKQVMEQLSQQDFAQTFIRKSGKLPFLPYSW